jgi:hypothetical protein
MRRRRWYQNDFLWQANFLCFVQIIFKHDQENTRIQPAAIEVVANPWQIPLSKRRVQTGSRRSRWIAPDFLAPWFQEERTWSTRFRHQ